MRMYQRLAACCLAAVLCFLGGCQQGPETVSSNLESQETAHPLLSKAPRVETAPVDSLSLEELREAMALFCICAELACAKKLLEC